MNSRGLSHEVFYLNGVLAWGLMAIAIVMLKSFFSENMPDALTLCAGEGLATAVGHAYVQAGGSAPKVRKGHSKWR